MNVKGLKRKVVFLVPDNVHLLDLSGPAHVFYEAKQAGVPLTVSYARLNNKSNTESSAGLFFSNLKNVDQLDLRTGDFVFIPGSESILDIIEKNRHFLSYFKGWHKKGVNICSICVGVFWLGEAGLINGKKSTTHWRYLVPLQEKYPDTIVQDNKVFVIEGNLFMSAGVSSGIDLSLHILETLYGFKIAAEIAKEIVYFFRRDGDDSQLSKFLDYQNHTDATIHRTQDYIMNNLNKKFTLDDIAAAVNTSKRNLSRKFKKPLV